MINDDDCPRLKVGDRVGVHGRSDVGDVVELAYYSHANYARICTRKAFHSDQTELVWWSFDNLERPPEK